MLAPPENAFERRYALRAVKQRLHQASFRVAVITAYNGRCAVSGLPESLLLDAAHIVADKDERLGQPVVPNGLLAQNDGPMLEVLNRLHGNTIHLPNRPNDFPDRDRLAMRFERFVAVS
jgi:putative restriction endonuclease